MEWIYEGKEITELPPNVFGFVYLITYTNGNKYIGLKKTVSTKTLPALKNGTIRPNAIRINKREKMTSEELSNRSKTQLRTNVKSKLVPYDKVIKEAKWRDYEGSSEETIDLTIDTKEILEFAPTSNSLRYLEEKYLFCKDAIIDNIYLNKNIGGRYFRDNLF